MEIKISAFGKLADIMGSNRVSLKNITNSKDLLEYLQNKYPMISAESYQLVVNNTIMPSEKEIIFMETDKIAIVSLFHGG
ncbi:MAG: MoaD/ThiS family protein [bacterium]